MKIINGDSLKELKTLEENSIDAVVTDPPYGLKFMGKKWDYDVPSTELWVEVMRVLKPGGHLLSFAGSRTYHRMAVNIEDAGFEIRDQIMWVYGSGFPKSHNIGKSVDKLQGNERNSEIVKGKIFTGSNNNIDGKSGEYEVTKGSSPYEGWGTALKPAHEPIVVARKPLSEKTIAKNVLEWGTGGINIDGCRVEYNKEDANKNNKGDTSKKHENAVWKDTNHKERRDVFVAQGRFPANFIHDGSDEVVGLFPESKSTASKGHIRKGNVSGDNRTSTGAGQFGDGAWVEGSKHNDSGSASRFFYCAKASKKDRNEGLPIDEPSTHPTVKPTALMQYLVRLVTPVGGTVLDPFMGSGSTGKACVLEGFDFIGIELDPEYCKIAQARIDAVK